MRIAIAQHNPIVGDLRGNVERPLAAGTRAKEMGADLMVAPELALTGYPPRDLLDRPVYIQECLQALGKLCREATMPMLVGAVVSHQGDPTQGYERIANGAVLVVDQKIAACHRKNLLPSYDVFDETRYFTPGQQATCAVFKDTSLGITVCEDAWNDKDYWPKRRYDRDPVSDQVAMGAGLLINLSASPYDCHKPDDRLSMLRATARRHDRPLLYVNQTGGNDSLIFDGRSMALGREGTVTLRCAAYKEVLTLGTYDGKGVRGDIAALPSSWEEDVIDALCLGTADYVHKCGFNTVLVGLSGGIDSALVATLAARALGPSRVIGIAMPSPYSSQGSIDDALDLAKRLNIRCDMLPINDIFASFISTLKVPFASLPADATEENLQARIRGTLLMAYANKFNALLLTTGNKSESAVGYCTLYGDMNGALGPIADLYKTQVYALSRWYNQHIAQHIPAATLSKPPSAELRPGQLDQDSLPAYELLDAILKGYIDEVQGAEALIARGHPAQEVRRILSMVDRNEYKRRQMAPSLRVSRKAFGDGRRIPIAHRVTRV